ncbi:hypothetical protein ARAM_004210 [Aspergillus rambellii]|uniref:Aminoglycoside phosphotransferase domain-containing protein n=1 Tax=Aspergillus rambellii TaxID=308745 RepID=A0A0F8U2T3_9EURO|nr:hypothetical protein ARAM_004210 [Aspergillus rambellii]
MDPYAADPEKIPTTDLYADLPSFGRYYPKPDDFRIEIQHVNSRTPESLRYWASVVGLCTEENQICPSVDGTRAVFVLGSVIVKSNHLHARDEAQWTEIDRSYGDSNEVQAIALAKTVLKDIKVPEIYFAGEINGLPVIIQERLPGVVLGVAWPYLSIKQKNFHKEEARKIIRQLYTIKPPENLRGRSYVVPDPNILTNGRLDPREPEILFSSSDQDPDMNFMHNDFNVSNCIVDKGKIVGLFDWEMAGFFGWKTAGEVHHRIRSFHREDFVEANLSEEKLQDLVFWNDLYDTEH